MPIRIECPSCGLKLQAPGTAAGKRVRCSGCKEILTVPDEIVDAEDFGAADKATSNASRRDLSDRIERDAGASNPAEEGRADRQPCPLCGEMISTAAAKCRFCGEIFDATLRRVEEKKKKKAPSVDSQLQPVNWVMCIIPLNIGCIVGLIYAIQGKPKGLKMVGLNLLCQIIVGFMIGIVGEIVK